MQKRHVTVCLALLAIVGVLFLVRPMIFPCLLSIAVAYLFNPLVVNFERHKVPRLYSVIFIVLALLMVFILTITFILPVMYAQITSVLNFLVSKSPSLNLKIIPSILKFFNIKTGDGLFDHLSKNLVENYGNYISYFIKAFDITGDFMIQLLSSSLSLVHTVSLVIITPVIFFYVLRDWPLIIAKVSELIPILYREKVTIYFSKIDFIVSNYLKGQINVCVVMMIFYSVGLGIIGLKHSVAVGILSGMLTFIPYIGPLIYTFIGFLSAIAQFGGWFESTAVLLLLGTGQLIDANILVPLLIGKKVNIHPAVIILEMATCISYLGLIGVLLFVPIMAIFNISVGYAVDAYLQSEFYKRG